MSATEGSASAAPPPNPYVGPRSLRFGEKIYGRDLELAQLRDVLIAQRIVLFYSPSGAGKSSLLEAGLRPELTRQGFHVLPTIRVGHEPTSAMRGLIPRNRYVLSVVMSLEEGRPTDQLMDTDRLASITLDDYLSEAFAHDGDLEPCLLLDQFEELFTLDPTDYAQKAAFLEELGVSLRDRSRWALIAMREDFIAQLDPYLSMIPKRLSTRFRLDLLSVDAARAAIRKPAQEVGVEFTVEAAKRLVDDLRRVRVQRGGSVVEELGPYVEPVQLQVVCRQLWQSVMT